MHRTLKAETTRPPAGNRAAQQKRFNGFRQEFNHERPHEAIEMNIPASRYEPSPRPLPSKVPPLDYPDHFEVRYVSFNGGIRWKRDWVNVSIVCAGEYVGLEEIDNGYRERLPWPSQTRSLARTTYDSAGTAAVQILDDHKSQI